MLNHLNEKTIPLTSDYIFKIAYLIKWLWLYYYSRCFNKIIFLFLNAGAIEIHRGYEVESIDCDDYQPIDHIVFLVHGMGQLYHGEGGIIHSRKK